MSKSYDIAGYTYKVENYRPDELRELLISEGVLSPGARGMTVEEALDQAAAVEGIDRLDQRTFDSGEFPKVIFEDQWNEDDED